MPSAAVSTEQLEKLVKEMCLGGKGYPELSGGDALITHVTNEITYDLSTILHEVYSHCRSSVRWVNASQQFDQEEARAYVLARLLGYIILPAEARPIGESARHAAVAFKGKPRGAKPKPKKTPADQELKDAASKAKSKAKSDAAKDAKLAAGLVQQIAGIDSKLDADRRKLALAVVSLAWPPRNT